MLFGTSGIRGVYGKEVDEKLAMKIANLFADCDVVIGRDTRTTGESLAFAAIAGVLGRGKNVIYLGIVPTPTLAFATQKYKCKGIILTASHNPSEYNGIKLYDNGAEISRNCEKELEKRFEKEKMQFTNWDKVGKMIDDHTILQEHAAFIQKLVNVTTIKTRKPKVVVDANGAGTVMTSSLLRELSCNVVEINNQLIGFSRESEPNTENLKGLSVKVREVNADLGIGHDSDADRTVVVDENGEVLALDVQLAIMIEHELENEKNKIKYKNQKLKIISTVEASLCVRDAVTMSGAEIIITPVGSLYVSEAMENEDAIFGGEPCGEYIFRDALCVPDGILTAAKFVEIFCEKGKLSELKKKYCVYPMLREKFKCDNSIKYKIVEKIKKEIKTKGRLRDDNGIRVDETDGWFLIRASGTEPYVRLTMEYKSNKKLEKTANRLREIIKIFKL